MNRHINEQEIERSIRKEARIFFAVAAYAAPWGAGALLLLSFMAAVGLWYEVSGYFRLDDFVDGLLIYVSFLAPAALGFGQLGFYARRMLGERGRSPGLWWASSFALNLGWALYGVGLAMSDSLVPGVIIAALASPLALLAADAGLQERELAAHRRWQEVPDLSPLV